VGRTISEELARIRSFFQEPVLRVLILGILFVAAFCLRLYGLDRLPMEFNPLREYHGALLGRGLYEWLTTGELRTMPPDGIIEPPILELLASFSYLILGGEHLWIPRLLSVLFWMVGGAFLYLIAKRIVSPNAAVFSVFFYLFVPYGVLASRAFMPDPLMIMLLVISIFTILRYHEQPSRRRLMIAVVPSALVIFVKPGICLFQVFGAFVSLAVYRQGIRKALASPHFLTFTTLSFLPAGIYGLYVTFFVSGYLRTQSHKIAPQLLLQPSFWGGWLETVWYVMGFVAILGALLGVLLSRKGLPRALLLGLWGGYFLFGSTFSHHVSTVTYYSLQLIPVVALSLGPIADLVMKHLEQTVAPNRRAGKLGVRGYGRAIVAALSVAVLILSAAANRETSDWLLAQQDRASSYVATAQEIGKVVDHSSHTLVLFGGYISTAYYPEPNYAYALMYHGQFSGDQWTYPSQPGSFQEQKIGAAKLFSRRYLKHSPEYFIISTGWWEREETKGLRTFLTENFPMAAQGNNYLVFDLSRHVNSPGGESS
jgi:4-amino-4-deoxy-L-arabinose transferase-like glycosyltransferase